MSATAGAAGRVKPWRIAVSLAMSSLMTESVIDHAGPVSDHPNPVIDHKVLTEAISRTKRTSNSRRPCPLSADITSSEGSKPQERAGLRWHSLVVYQRLIEFV